jgi:hypothetical protein
LALAEGYAPATPPEQRRRSRIAGLGALLELAVLA